MLAASYIVSFTRMDDSLLIVGCVTILLLSYSVHCHAGVSCNYLYQQQPGKANCNPESPLPLQLNCHVQGNNNFTIQWHYSNSPPAQESVTSKGTVIIDNTSIASEVLSPSVLVSTLTLEYNQAAGYYWCTVNASDSTPNPSQILNIITLSSGTCPFNGDAPMMPKCMTNIGLFEIPGTNRSRCADHNVSIDIVDVQLGSIEPCEMKSTGTVTTLDITEPITHRSNPSPTTDDDTYTSEEPATTERTSFDHELSTTSLTQSNQFPMHYVWMIVGVAFVLLIAIIIIMLIAIIYLNYKKNKIRVSNKSTSLKSNTYVENGNPDSSKRVFPMEETSANQQESISAEANAYKTAFSADHSPNGKTSPPWSALLGDYEELDTVETARDSIKAAQRNQYELVESGDQSEYSHLQHTHGGSRKFNTSSTGTAPSPSVSQNRGKISITSSLSLSGRQPEPVFDSPEYETIELDGSKSTKTAPEGVMNPDTEYSHIDCEVLKSTKTTTREAEDSDLDSEGYHQLPSVFTGVAKQLPNSEISPEQRENSCTTNTHPPARRYKSATSEPYTPVETTNVMKRNTYSFTIVSTDERYVSERGHMYHLLERSDEHQCNQLHHSNEGSPKFCIQEDNSVEKSDSNSPHESSMENSGKVIPPYSQVDKSKKKNRKPQIQLDDQLNQETHHLHQ